MVTVSWTSSPVALLSTATLYMGNDGINSQQMHTMLMVTQNTSNVGNTLVRRESDVHQRTGSIC